MSEDEKEIKEEQILTCPHCKDYIIIRKINCGIFRHCVLKNGKQIDPHATKYMCDYYVRENKNNVCPTLTANMGGGGHNVPIILDNQGIRKLTPRECFNLQGFPKDYKLPLLSDSKLYSLAGNAVSIPVISLIVNQIMKVLE